MTKAEKLEEDIRAVVMTAGAKKVELEAGIIKVWFDDGSYLDFTEPLCKAHEQVEKTCDSPC
jgi:hypothetical protein